MIIPPFGNRGLRLWRPPTVHCSSQLTDHATNGVRRAEVLTQTHNLVVALKSTFQPCYMLFLLQQKFLYFDFIILKCEGGPCSIATWRHWIETRKHPLCLLGYGCVHLTLPCPRNGGSLVHWAALILKTSGLGQDFSQWFRCWAIMNPKGFLVEWASG